MILVNMDKTTTNKKYFYWNGGTLDGSNVPESGPGEANDIMYIDGGDGLLNKSIIENVTFTLRPGYTDTDTMANVANGDCHLFMASTDNATVRKCEFYFTNDSAIYISAAGTNQLGEKVLVDDCYFYECTTTLVTKRSHKKTIATNNRIVRCLNGISQGEADGIYETGVEVIINYNYFERCDSSVELRKQDGAIASGNIFRKIGYSATSTYPAAIKLRGSKRCVVSSNVIDGINSLAATHVSGIVTANKDGVLNQNNVIICNIIDSVSRGIEKSNNLPETISRNVFLNNTNSAVSNFQGVTGDVTRNGRTDFYNEGINKFSVDSSGNFLLNSLPTAATGLPTGAVWRDSAAGNVLKIV